MNTLINILDTVAQIVSGKHPACIWIYIAEVIAAGLIVLYVTHATREA